MNNIKSFSFYRNYYEIIKFLPEKERLKLYDAIMEYVFEDKEPTLKDLSNGIWINLKMPLDTSKNNAGRGGRPLKKDDETETEKKPNKNRKETDNKTEKKTNIIISNFLFLKDKRLLREKIEEWLKYKKERKDKPYTEIGLNKLLKQIENNSKTYGEQQVINIIDECMGNNYQGIIFDKLKKQKPLLKIEEEVPDWFNKDNKSVDLSENDTKEMDDILDGICN